MTGGRKPVVVPPVYRPGAASAPRRTIQAYQEVTATNPIGALPIGARVSENNKLVLLSQGSQDLYATPSRISEGNNKLRNVGPFGSFVRLTSGAATVQVPDPKRPPHNQTLHNVIPEWVQKPGVMAFDKAAIANTPGGSAPLNSVNQLSGPGVPMALNSECGAAASAVLGTGSGFKHVYQGNWGKATGHRFHHSNAQIEGERALSEALWQFMQRTANANFLVLGVHYQPGKYFGRTLIKPTHAVPGAATFHRTMYDALTGNGRQEFRRQTGINEYANPQIGHAYNIRPDGLRAGWQKMPGVFTWQHHYAAVVMKDGRDNVTLENFNFIGQPINRDWLFNMYGTAAKQQTFHHYEKNVARQFGTSATTMPAKPV